MTERELFISDTLHTVVSGGEGIRAPLEKRVEQLTTMLDALDNLQSHEVLVWSIGLEETTYVTDKLPHYEDIKDANRFLVFPYSNSIGAIAFDMEEMRLHLRHFIEFLTHTEYPNYTLCLSPFIFWGTLPTQAPQDTPT